MKINKLEAGTLERVEVVETSSVEIITTTGDKFQVKDNGGVLEIVSDEPMILWPAAANLIHVSQTWGGVR